MPNQPQPAADFDLNPYGVLTINRDSAWGVNFQERQDIRRVVIMAGVTMIEGEAFSGCNNLTSVVIPNSVTTIRDGAFEGCKT